MTTRPRLVALAVTALVLLLALVFVTPARSVPEPTPAPVTSWTPVAAPRFAPVSSGAVGASVAVPARSGASPAQAGPTASAPTPSPVVVPPSEASRLAGGESPVSPGRGAVDGVASWYCLPGRSACTAGVPADRMAAAAGPALRYLLGTWVSVCAASGTCVRVQLVDVCACPGGRLIDLYARAFAHLAPLGLGLVTVEVAR